MLFSMIALFDAAQSLIDAVAYERTVLKIEREEEMDK